MQVKRSSPPGERPVRGRPALLLLAAAAWLAVAPTARGQEAGHAHDDIGRVDFRVSCAAGVRADFDGGVALLHHMMYDQARSVFEEIAAQDPECGMAHWGIGMTLFHPLWFAADAETLRRGFEAIGRARALGARTEREEGLLAAAEAFYREPEAGGWYPRLQRWHAAMEEAYGRDPDDIETGALYALSLLAAGQVAEDRLAWNAKAARILLAIHEREPSHPGATHYTIHANDVTERAAESLEIVRGYDEIAPSVPHALHMPTHIFVRLGEWPGVIEWNRKSADAALDLPAGDRISLHYPHAMDYLLYAHLQRGEVEAARAALEETLTREERYQDDFVVAFHLAAMPARFAVERRAWEEAAALEPRTPAYLSWDRFTWAEALTWFARGLGAARSGDLTAAREAESRMETLRDAAEAQGERGYARYIEIDRSTLAAFIALAEGDADAAVAGLRAAAELEGTIQKHPVTPGALLPPHEALGDVLSELGRPAEALEAYEASLRAWPGRLRSRLGAARAAEVSGAAKRAREHQAALPPTAPPR